MSNNRILLPLDGSKTSLTALLPAKSIAYLLNMVIHILYVSEKELTYNELLSTIQIDESDFPRSIISHKVGNPAEVILKESENAAYIVMCTHGSGYDESKLTGSVSSQVMENSTAPVLLIRPDVVLTRENDLWEPKHVLIPLNGTPGASQALTPAMDIALKTKAKIDLLHISFSGKNDHVEPGAMTVPYYEDYPQYEWPSWSREFLRRFCTLSCSENPDFYVSTGDPGEEILNFARKNKNDLIAMAWHGRILPPHASTLRKVMFEAPCPILLTRIFHKNGHHEHHLS